MGSQRVRHDWATSLSSLFLIKIYKDSSLFLVVKIHEPRKHALTEMCLCQIKLEVKREAFLRESGGTLRQWRFLELPRVGGEQEVPPPWGSCSSLPAARLHSRRLLCTSVAKCNCVRAIHPSLWGQFAFFPRPTQEANLPQSRRAWERLSRDYLSDLGLWFNHFVKSRSTGPRSQGVSINERRKERGLATKWYNQNKLKSLHASCVCMWIAKHFKL